MNLEWSVRRLQIPVKVLTWYHNIKANGIRESVKSGLELREDHSLHSEQWTGAGDIRALRPQGLNICPMAVVFIFIFN